MKTIALALFAWLLFGQNAGDRAAALKARDSADVPALQQIIARHADAPPLYRAELLFYLTEAAYVDNQLELMKSAGLEGFAAAEKATEADPKSSEAHRLQSDFASLLISSVPDGAAKYGARSTGEADKALALDDKNANAYISRSLGYFYTPPQYGGNKDKAIELLNKAVAIDPAFDTPHIVLAQAYLATARPKDALREISEARRLNPSRRVTEITYKSVTAVIEKSKSQEK